MIPLCDVTRQYVDLKDEIDGAMQAVAAEGRYILGPNGRSLEDEIAARCDCKHAVGVASGTDALHLALRGLGIGPGDEVITTPFTFVATTEAIGMVGATPVFADIDPLTFNIDPTHVEAVVTSRTRAILPVHLFGQPCDMDRLIAIAKAHGLFVVEDCAQAIGAKWRGRAVGSFGDAGCFSFFPSKNLGGIGDGGMLTTNSPELYAQVEMLRRHGGRVKYHHETLGLNSRLDELQAAILRVKLTHLEDWNRLRRQHAHSYNRMLADQQQVTCPHELTAQGPVVAPGLRLARETPELEAVYHQYTILVDDRDAVAAHLTAAGIGNAVYYPICLHLQQVHEALGHGPGDFPLAEAAAARCLSLPMFPQLELEQQQEVFRALNDACSSSRRKVA